MWLESEVGAGSTFGFAFPVRRARSERAGRAPRLPGSTSIVVIEDDRRSLDLMTAYLSGAAITVVTARDGQSGLEAVRRDHPSAVLLDIRMPGHRRLGGPAGAEGRPPDLSTSPSSSSRSSTSAPAAPRSAPPATW